MDVNNDSSDDVSSPEPHQAMKTTSDHHFRDSNSSDDVISITIIESMKEEYGLFVWPCSLILAEYVWQHRVRFAGVNVLELGAGTSLPGLVAAKVGANVVLTDDADRSEVLDNMRRVCELNNVKCEVMGLTWGVWDESFFSLQPQVILGADVLYDSSAFDNLFATVKLLLENSPGSVFITSYHNRSGHHLIEFLMVKWQLKCVKLLDGFSFLPPWKASGSMKEEYGLFVWPCSLILAEYVWQHRVRFAGVNVLELGAGTSLPGLVAAKVGANVVLTDDADRSEVLDNMRRVCELNNVKCEVMGLTWGVWDESFFSLQPQVILGADVLYDSSAFDNLFATVKLLLENSPGSVFITSYHNRSGHHLIEFLMVKWQLKCVKLLDGFSFLPPWKASGVSGNIQLVEIALSDVGKN
ncbi:hypothetical protein CTI12_AA007270 [Artemisia annua]|uniref:Methyltransferase family protein n=1 Tax=Artemisia annua TaxID=35608 RepID=A0A2U1QHL3_ARTAN|nr:hypothetical protein CTI12_AA007270 [Artemisia annua]